MDGENTADLDKLIQSFEFENQQYVKCIEQENQHIEALEKEIDLKKTETERLQEDISKLDEDTKRAHKQFILNRDNVESLKKTLVVLKDHEAALQKTLADLIEKGNKTRQERADIIKHYQNIWKDYEAKYKSFPLAIKLEEKKESIRNLENEVKTAELKVQALQKQIDDYKSNEEFRDLNKFIVKIAELKVGTSKIEKEIKCAYKEKQSIDEKIRLAEKKREEEEAARREQETVNEQMEVEEDETSHETSALISMIKDSEEDENFNVGKVVLSHPLEQQSVEQNSENAHKRSPTDVSLQPNLKKNMSKNESESDAISLGEIHLEFEEKHDSPATRPPVISMPQIQQATPPNISQYATEPATPQFRMTAPQIVAQNKILTPQSVVRPSLPHVITPTMDRTTPQTYKLAGQVRPRPPTPQVSKHRPIVPQVPYFPKFEVPQSPQLQRPITNFSSSQQPKRVPTVITPSQQTEHMSALKITSISEEAENQNTTDQSSEDADQQPKSPFFPPASPQKPKTPKTPESMSIENELKEFSPFDMEKHKKRLMMLKKSPGQPQMESRPMYSAEKIDPNKDHSSGIFTGITTFNLFDSQTKDSSKKTEEPSFGELSTELAMFSSSLAGGDVCSNAENSSSYFDKPDGKKMTNFFSCKSPDLGLSDSGFSFGGGGNKSGTSSIMSLFGDSSDNQGQGDNNRLGGSSFMSFFGGMTSDEKTGENKSGGNSIMSLFGDSASGDQTQETSFSFSFGGSGNDETNQGFSFF